MGSELSERGPKQPRRPHFIDVWATSRGLSQADLARQLNADKSIVSRWYSGTSPGDDWQKRLAEFFGCEPEALFRHPDEEWLRQFFAGRSEAEVEHIKRSLEVLFPRK